MPYAIVKGVVQSPTKHPGEAGPCEWCGQPMTYRPNVPGCRWTVQPAELEPTQPRYSSVYFESGTGYVTRLCEGCQTISMSLGKAGLKELPDQPTETPSD